MSLGRSLLSQGHLPIGLCPLSLPFCTAPLAFQEAHTHHTMRTHAQGYPFLPYMATNQSINTTRMPIAYLDYYDIQHVSASIAKRLKTKHVRAMRTLHLGHTRKRPFTSGRLGFTIVRMHELPTRAT